MSITCNVCFRFQPFQNILLMYLILKLKIKHILTIQPRNTIVSIESLAAVSNMKPPKVVGFDINVLSRIMLSVTSKRFLEFIDFTSVIACMWMVFWLICSNFVKDSIEILTYATFKYANRFIWLCKLLHLDILLKRIHDFLETCELNYSTEVENISSKEICQNSLETNTLVNNSERELPRISPESTPSSFKNKVDIKPRRIDFVGENRSRENSLTPQKSTVLVSEQHVPLYPENNSVPRTGEDAVFSTEKNLICSSAEYLDSNTNVILNSMKNEANRYAVNCEPDAVFASPDQELSLKQKFFTWNINTIRNSFRKERNGNILPALSVKVKCKDIAGKVIQVQPTKLEDKERLILTNDSPVSVGCCNSLFINFKSKLQMKEQVPTFVHYKKF